MIRLICPFKLNVDFQTKKVGKPTKPIKKCIVHFHGGGFVAMDSGSH